jgi:hypothetical protein
VRCGWRKLRNGELRVIYCSLNVVREEQGTGHVARMGGKCSAHGVLVGKL